MVFLPLAEATIIILIILYLLYIIDVFLSHWLLCLLLPKDGHGIFNVRNHFSACRPHEGETGPDESLQVLIRN